MSKSLNKKRRINKSLLRKIQAQTGRYLGDHRLQMLRTENARPRLYTGSTINSINHWIDVLSSDDPGLRLQALETLARLDDDRATPAICEVLRNDPEPEVRCLAAKVLGQIFG
jgi:hypothetical protein